MELPHRLLLRLCLSAGLTSLASAATIFQDGFESGSLGPAWNVSTSNDGRASVTTNFAPATGQWHLVLDDSVSDGRYSVAQATFHLDLVNKRNVLLTFKAKSLGNEPDPGALPSNYDGVAVSADGGATWRPALSLAWVGTDWETFSIPLDFFAGWWWGPLFGPDFRVRFSEYDNAPAPLDGIAIDDVLVTADDDQRAVLELPNRLIEGTGPHTGHALLALAPTNTLTLSLSASPPDQLTLPATVEVPAGQTDATFSFSVADDHLVNLTRTVTLEASGPGVTTIPAQVTILDDDAPVARLTIPARLKEGDFLQDNSSITLDRIADVTLTLSLTASPWNELSFPYTVTIPPGETQAVFAVQANDDTVIDGNIVVTVTGSEPSMPPATAQTTTVDNESRTLSLILPATVQEGGTATGTAMITGTLTTPLVVHLTSLDEAALTVPLSLTIPAGQTQATFVFTAQDNAIRDGSRVAGIGALADTFTGTNAAVTIRDDEVASYRFGGLSGVVNASEPVTITVAAEDREGNVIDGFRGTVNLSVVLWDGTIQPVTPAAVELAGATGWNGTITFPRVMGAPLRLRATDGSGNSGDSVPFDMLRVLNVPAADLAWDPARNRLYASVPAAGGGTNADGVIVIDPVNAQISGRILTGQDPGQLALTGGGEYLYVALNANGRIARIDPAAMAVASTFAVGTSPSDGTLYAADMCTVAGQPDLLVVSQKRLISSLRHKGVAVYDHGIARPNKTPEYPGSDVIEPSADPTIFFGYNPLTTEFGFRRLRLDASGMSEIEVKDDLIGGFGVDIRSAGNRVFSTTGVELDGARMKRLGTFPAGGPVCPDLAANRVYFLENPQHYYYPLSYDRIGAYDPMTFSHIRTLTLPSTVNEPRGFVRWGTNGLAFATDAQIVLISSDQLVPSGPPANLAVTIQAVPNPAALSELITYSVCLSNQGPNIARSAVLEVTLSDGQTIQSVVATAGTPVLSDFTVTLPVGAIGPAECVTATITTLPQSAGVLTCNAGATSRAIDADYTDNRAGKVVSVAFQSAINTVNRLRLTANNLIYDPTRNRLWASIPLGAPAPLGRSIVSIDPATGLVSEPILINADPKASCTALSENGRYLYVGLRDSPEVLRLDLDSGPSSTYIPLHGPIGTGDYALDIEPLDGDGTSFLIALSANREAAVYDGFVARTSRTGVYSVERVERTGTPGVFVGYASSIGNRLSRLSVSAAGVSISQYVDNLFMAGGEIRGAGNLVLSSTGFLADSDNLTLLASLGAGGSPCLDLPNRRAYVVNGNILRGFDSQTSFPTATFTLPAPSTGDWAQSCVRWGLDGFAILGNDGGVYILRWSSTIPATTDANSDGISDAWEAAYFGVLNVDPAADGDEDGIRNFQEYIFATSPLEASSDPLQVSTATVGGQLALRLVFPRRAGLVPRPYDYVISPDLAQWTVAPNVSETVLSVQSVDGTQIETVEALIPAVNPKAGFLRFRWNPQ